MSKTKDLKISVSGIRGIVGEAFTPKLISSFASAFGQFVGGGSVVIGRDTRPSGIMVEQAVCAGLLAVGCQPILVDILPTPSVQLLVKELRASGAIVISASHNPMNWNALKLINGDGYFLNTIEARQLKDLYNQADRAYVGEDSMPRVLEYSGGFEVHKKAVLENVDVEKIRAAGFKVAVDCCNGAGALFAVDFLEHLGCEVIGLHTEADGIFRRPAEPIPKNLYDLEKAVVDNNCAIGFAQDPDADRLVLVNDKGQALNENLTLAIAARHILAKTPGPVTVNLATSKILQDIAEEFGQPFYLSKIGEINVSSMMRANGSVIGGESNGGVIWPQVWACRDSFTGMALILQYMAERKSTLSSILSEMQPYFGESRKYPMTPSSGLKLIRLLKQKYSHCRLNNLDGLRIDWDDRWVLVRSSNTEPVIRLIGEAQSKEALDELMNDFEVYFKEDDL